MDRLVAAEKLGSVAGLPPSCPEVPVVPFKLNQNRRCHSPRARRRLANWRAYDASLRERGSLMVWLCVRQRLSCSAGDKPAGVEVKAP